MAQIVHFKNLVNNEITNLAKLCDKWNDIFSNGDAPEEDKGNILAVIGQTKLLIKKKFTKFTNLIQQCEKNDSDQKITLDDLHGFWDLIYIEIQDINNKFIKLAQKEANKWRPVAEDTIENNNSVVTKKSRKPSSSSFQADSDAAKLRLNAAKAAMQERLKLNQK